MRWQRTSSRRSTDQWLHEDQGFDLPRAFAEMLDQLLLPADPGDA
jgi:hypothetical protein